MKLQQLILFLSLLSAHFLCFSMHNKNNKLLNISDRQFNKRIKRMKAAWKNYVPENRTPLSPGARLAIQEKLAQSSTTTNPNVPINTIPITANEKIEQKFEIIAPHQHVAKNFQTQTNTNTQKQERIA